MTNLPILTSAHMPESSHWILAYYHFDSIENPHLEVKTHKDFFANRAITCRIYISEQGINGQMSGSQEDAKAYIQWMHENPLFETMPFKIHPYHENVFPNWVHHFPLK